MWVEDNQCEEVIKEAWRRGRSSVIIRRYVVKIDHCMSILQRWNKTEFGHMHDEINKRKDQLAGTHNVGHMSILLEEIGE